MQGLSAQGGCWTGVVQRIDLVVDGGLFVDWGHQIRRLCSVLDGGAGCQLQTQRAIGIGNASGAGFAAHRDGVGGAVDGRDAQDLGVVFQAAGEHKVTGIHTSDVLAEDQFESDRVFVGDVFVSHRCARYFNLCCCRRSQHRLKRRRDGFGGDLDVEGSTLHGERAVLAAVSQVEDKAVVRRVASGGGGRVGVAVLELAAVNVGLGEGSAGVECHFGPVDRAVPIVVQPQLAVARQRGHGVGDGSTVVIRVQFLQVFLGDGGGLLVGHAELFGLDAGRQVQIAPTIHAVDAIGCLDGRCHIDATAVGDGEIGKACTALTVIGKQAHGECAAARWCFCAEGAGGRVKTDPAGQFIAIHIARAQCQCIAGVAIGEGPRWDCPDVFVGVGDGPVGNGRVQWRGLDGRVVGVGDRQFEGARRAVTVDGACGHLQ